ncbi:MAG: AAA family ATPase [Candidatus Nitrosotenuis sp.]
MRKSDIDALVQKVALENHLFKNKAALDGMQTPKNVIGRKEQVEKLVRFLAAYQHGMVPPFVSVYGRSGSGKSTLVRFVCENLDGIAFCFVNLRSAKTIFECANLILSGLGAEALPSAKGLGATVLEMNKAIVSFLEKEKKNVFVLVLDEFDMIFYDKRNKPSDFVYKLVVLGEQLKKKNYQMCIVGISNNVVSEYDLDDRVRSRIGNAEVFFPAYAHDEALEILRKRSAEAFVEEIDDSVLQHCAKLSSQEHGDARRALDLLRVGAEIAGIKNEKISTTHIDLASIKLQNDRVIEIVGRLTPQSRAICGAIVYLSYVEGNEFNHTSNIFDEYKIVRQRNIPELTYRRVSEILTDLENTGLISSQAHSRGRHGYGKKYKLSFSPDLVGPAIGAQWWDDLVKMKKQMDKSAELDWKNGLPRKTLRAFIDGTPPEKLSPDVQQYVSKVLHEKRYGWASASETKPDA